MILASIWGIFGIVRPHYGTITALRAQQSEYEATLAKASEARIMRETLLGEYNSIQPEEWDKMNKMLPNESRGVQLAQDMSELARTFGIKITKFSFDDGGGAAGASSPSAGAEATLEDDSVIQDINIPAGPALQSRKLQISFTFEATYPDFLRFLREIERNLELSDVRSLTLSRGAQAQAVSGTPSNRYTLALKIDTYWVQ